MESYEFSLLPHTQPQYLIWPTLLHFAAMSTEFISAGDTYKLTVYGNLFAGIVYGKILG